MKCSLTFIVFSVILFFCSSCVNEEEVSLNIDRNSLFFAQEEETKTFSVIANQSWLVSIPEGWCVATPKKGKGNADVSIKVLVNEGYADRTCLVSVTSEAITKTISITQTGRLYVPLKLIELNPESVECVAGRSIDIQCKALPENATGKDSIAWSCNNTQIATVNSRGTINAISVGSCIITASYVNGNVEKSCELTVLSSFIPVASIVLEPENASCLIGEVINIHYKVSPENATGKDSIEWNSGDNRIATVDKNGVVRAISIGKSIITAKYMNGDIIGTCELTVLKPVIPLEGIYFSEKENQFTFGSTGNIGVHPIPADAELPEIIYKSSNPEVLSVDPFGNYKTADSGSDCQVVVFASTLDGTHSVNMRVEMTDLSVFVHGHRIVISETNREASFMAEIQSSVRTQIVDIALYDHYQLFRGHLKYDSNEGSYCSDYINLNDMTDNGGDELFNRLSTWYCLIDYLSGSDTNVKTKRVEVNAHTWY